MELFLLLLVSYYLADHLITDTAYAVRGQDPPRHKERMARMQSGGAPSSRYQSGRHGASRFFAEAWHDAWDDAHSKRQELREKRKTAKAEKPAEQAEPTNPQAQPDGTVDAPGALRPQERVEPGGNVIPLAARGRRAAEPEGGTATATLDRPATTSEAAHDTDKPNEAPGPRPGVPGSTITRPNTSEGTAAEYPRWPDAESAASDGTGVLAPQPDGTVETPGALVPASPGARTDDANGGRYETSTASEPSAPERPSPENPYPSLFTTATEWDAHFATLDPETRRTYEALCARVAAAEGAGTPVTVAEQAALFQARGYPPDVAQQAAERVHTDARRRGGQLMVGRFRRLPGEAGGRWMSRRSEQPQGQPAADGGGTVPSKETQEGNRMSVMTSNNTTGQPTGETAGLGSAIRFAEGMANSMRDAATRTETSVASLTGSEVGSGPIAALQQAMEAAANAASAYEHAKTELEKQLSVKEAYDATPDAGNKQFLQTD